MRDPRLVSAILSRSGRGSLSEHKLHRGSAKCLIRDKDRLLSIHIVSFVINGGRDADFRKTARTKPER
jgi:hypothetical protein